MNALIKNKKAGLDMKNIKKCEKKTKPVHAIIDRRRQLPATKVAGLSRASLRLASVHTY